MPKAIAEAHTAMGSEGQGPLAKQVETLLTWASCETDGALRVAHRQRSGDAIQVDYEVRERQIKGCKPLVREAAQCCGMVHDGFACRQTRM